MRNAMRLGVLIVVELVAVLILHALGDLPWLQVPLTGFSEWAAVTPAEDVVTAVARLLALAGAYWLLSSTLCYTAAAAARLPRAVQVAGWATLPAVRRVADRAVAVALVTSSVVGASSAAGALPAAGYSAPGVSPGAGDFAAGVPAGVPPRARDLAEGVPAGVPPPRGTPVATPPADAPAPPGTAPPPVPSPPADAPAPVPSPPADAPAAPSTLPGAPPPDRGGSDERPEAGPVTHAVAPGDNLWSITATYLEATGADHDPAAVRVVWLQVVAANRDRLRSGDPDLIYPGESITLSPLPAQGAASST